MFKLYQRYLLLASFFLCQFFFFPQRTFAENGKVFKTTYTNIFYSADEDLSDFLWRISGKRFDFTQDSEPAKSGVDTIIRRVQSILDMYPDNFHIKIILYPYYEEGMAALYSHKTKSITLYADRVTDGVFAHEVAHAVICNYFPEPPPHKIQEILAQYVDKYLWEDY